MGVADVALLAVDVSQNEIGRLASYAGQTEKVVHIVRHLAAEVAEQHLGAAHNILGLGPPEAAGADVFADLIGCGRREGFQCGEALKQCRRHQIHTSVGALGRQTDGEQQLVVLLILQRA